jgi:two-component system, probable response regulator PhcQ
MTNPYNYKQFAILYVDDEEKSLRNFTRAFGEQFRILSAPSAQEALKILDEHKDDIGLVMTDQRMPGEKGIWLLERARQLRPRIIRILATAYADLEVAIAAVNVGAVYKYVTKPWDPPQLETTLKRGLEFFMVQAERDQLLREKLSVLHNMMIADRVMSLGLLAAGLSHHIRNALVAVKTFLDLAPVMMKEEKGEAETLRNPDFWKEYHQSVQTQITRINGMLKELWVASEKPSFDFGDKVNVHQVAAHTIRQLKSQFHARNIEVENRIPRDLPSIQVDKAKFYRLFELLLRDELANLPEGRRVVLSGSKGGPGQNEEEIQIQISDNGPGLPHEAVRLVFDPFVVRSDSPMEFGIHLMACFFIVHHHGGLISAKSEDGGGTTFTLRLPVNPAKVPPAPNDHEFLTRLLLNQTLWENLITSD